VVLHMPLIQVVQKLLTHDVEDEDEDELEGADIIGTDGPGLGGIIGLATPQFGLLFAM
jgi:hypothetical protein